MGLTTMILEEERGGETMGMWHEQNRKAAVFLFF
jgi:hypothetical protein